MKNIAILIPTLSNGGAERVASNLSLHLPEKFKKYIILYDGNKIDYPYEGEIIDLQIKASDSFFSKLSVFLKRIYKVRKIKKELDIDVTISFLENPNVVNLFSKFKDKVIVSIHSFKSGRLKGIYGNIYKLIIKSFYNKAQSVVGVSQGIKNDLIEKFGLREQKIKVIYNSFAIKEIQKLMLEDVKEDYENIFKFPTVINVGRLNKVKGQWHLIRAFKKVKEEIPEAKLVILGKGELEKKLKKLTQVLKLNDDVHFLGFKENPFKFIRKAEVFAFSSLYEGFGNVLIESMACGTPVVSTDCKVGPREILAPNTNINIQAKEIEYGEYGILTPVFDGEFCEMNFSLTEKEESYAKGMLKLLRDNKLNDKYCSLAKERAKDFDIKEIISKWEEICK